MQRAALRDREGDDAGNDGREARDDVDEQQAHSSTFTSGKPISFMMK